MSCQTIWLYKSNWPWLRSRRSPLRQLCSQGLQLGLRELGDKVQHGVALERLGRPCILQAQAGASSGVALTTLKAVTTDVQAWAAQAARWAEQQGRLLRVMAGVVPVERSLHYPVGGERIAEQCKGEVTVVMLAEHLDGPACTQGTQWWADRMQAHHFETPAQQAFGLQTRVCRSQLALPASGRPPPLMELMAGYADC